MGRFVVNPHTGRPDRTGSDPLSPVYLGDPNTDGSWRIIQSGNNLAFERRESGVWVEKSSATP
jgi:hypothetical protein